MNKDKQHNKLVPQLRFPEFYKDWDMSELGNKKVSFFVNDKTPKEKLDIETYISTENLLPDYGGVKKSNKLPNSGSFTTYKSGDILIANIRPYLKKVWFADKEGTASNDVIVFRAGSSISEYFLQHILKNDIFINYVMKGAKGVKMPRGDKSLMKKYPVYFPNPKEQQKIANCLSSLDTYITAETEKLAHLKDHKKGLLQQLFPANGETKPLYRFPEFLGDGDWEEKCVNDFFEVGSSKRVLQKDWIKEGVPFYRTRELVSLSKNKPFGSEIYISEELFLELSEKYGTPKAGDFLVSGVGTLGILYQVKGNDKFYFKDGNVIWFKLNSGIVSDYFKHCFHTKLFQKQIFRQSSASTVGTYTISNARKTKFWKPVKKTEQQKIANCLSSIDDLIEAQINKIEALKEHKKGLMQQMFPNIKDS